jgi:hypothetical protein
MEIIGLSGHGNCDKRAQEQELKQGRDNQESKARKHDVKIGFQVEEYEYEYEVGWLAA